MPSNHQKLSNIPIDVVITWVDGNDPILTKKRNYFLERAQDINLHETQATYYASNNEIKYCVLSILKFAPFVRNIFILTDGQDPQVHQEVEQRYPGKSQSIKIVDHKEIFRGYEHYLPVFNIESILTLLWRIEGLSENFVYFNDDLFLVREMQPEDWFVDGKPVLRGQWLLPPYRKIAGNYFKILKNRYLKGNAGYKPKISFYLIQRNTAKILGFNTRYLFHCHYPHPISRKTVEDYFTLEPKLFEKNFSHRFKHPDQFTLTALSYHLEIQQGNRHFRKPNHVYLHPVYSKTKIYNKINDCMSNPEKKTVCAQNMDLLEGEVQEKIFDWMDKVLGLKQS
jgi:hypothetical protein